MIITTFVVPVILVSTRRILRAVPTNSEVCLHGFMWEKQILARAMEIQKENWGEPYIF